MKLGTRRDGSRDGQLVVVSRDNSRALPVPQIALNLQSALDRWQECAPQLEASYQNLCQSPSMGEPVDESQFMAPLPRAYEWIDGSAYINHVLLVRKARGAQPPPTLKTDPLIYQGGSGVLLGPCDPIGLRDESWGCDFESEVCVILGDTPQGISASDAGKCIKLVMIANDVSLRNLIPAELQKGFGFFQSKPATAFSPFCVTPDELGDAWQNGRLNLDMRTYLNNELFGSPNAGAEMHFSFHDLISHIAMTRQFTAGTILGSGTVSNEDRSRGSSCLAEQRMIEKIDTDSFKTNFLKVGDKVRIEMHNGDENIFGTISQQVEAC